MHKFFMKIKNLACLDFQYFFHKITPKRPDQSGIKDKLKKRFLIFFESLIIQGLSEIIAQIAQKRNEMLSGKTLDFDGKSAQWGNLRFYFKPL